jgi:hypothetical protein
MAAQCRAWLGAANHQPLPDFDREIAEVTCRIRADCRSAADFA